MFSLFFKKISVNTSNNQKSDNDTTPRRLARKISQVSYFERKENPTYLSTVNIGQNFRKQHKININNLLKHEREKRLNTKQQNDDEDQKELQDEQLCDMDDTILEFPKNLDKSINNIPLFKEITVKNSNVDQFQKFLAVNKDTGEVFDLRNPQECQQLNQNTLTPDKLSKSLTPWQNWWKEKKQISNELLVNAQLNNQEKCIELINLMKGDMKPDVNYKQQESGWTSLHFACWHGNTFIAQQLIQNDANIDSTTNQNITGLMLAGEKGFEQIVQLLIESGADINAIDSAGNTALHYAVFNNQQNIVQTLLNRPSLQADIKNKENKTAIQYADKEIMHMFEVYNENKKTSEALCKKIIIHSFEPQFQQQQQQFQQQKQYMQQINKQSKRNTCNQQSQQKENKKIKNQIKISNQSPLKEISNSIILRTEITPQKKNQLNIFDQLCDKSNKREAAQRAKNSASLKSQQSTKPSSFRHISGVSDFSVNTTKSQDKITLDSLKVHSLLGKGSFGEVYLVEKKDNNMFYAMKVLHKSKMMRYNVIKYAQTERNVLSITNHPFIVKLNYAFQTQDRLFLLLDYAPGGDLGRVLQREKKFNEERVKMYMAEILTALEDLHKRDIIFRDLKPDNIVLDKDGHALLTDFGLSKEGVPDYSQGAQSFCGSLAYLAPEMLKRCGYGKVIDWYLFGVVMYEMLVGIPPFYAHSKEQLFANIEAAPLNLPNHLSNEAKSLLKGLLQRNPIKRLGYGQKDSAEIKNHKFFQNINWIDVQQRKLKPPKPDIKEPKLNTYQNTAFLESMDLSENTFRHLNGWSFIAVDNIQ